MAVKIQFLGGVRTVTGSMHLIQSRHSNVLVDCGIFYGHRDESYEINSNFSFNLHAIDSLVLSHAHIDHSGNIPTLFKKGFRAKIYATSATKDLCSFMLPDSGKIQEEDIKFVNKINKKKGLPKRKPLYTEKDAQKCLKKFRGVQYYKKFRAGKDIYAQFHHAGHILGSAITVFEIHGRKQIFRLGYAVDLGRAGLPILKDPDIGLNLDYLIIESTYGNRLHRPIEEAENELADTVKRTVERGGKIIIPSFALERTQEVVYFLNILAKENKIPHIPVYIDSPLATNITDVFYRHKECLDKETKDIFKRGEDPFESKRITYVRSVQESKKLNGDKRPMIIIATSGMCEAGRVLHHLKNNIEDPKNTILIVGFMAKNTLGRQIADRQDAVRIFGNNYARRAEVVINNAFSGHADKNALFEYASNCGKNLKKVFIVHGDLEQSEAFYERLKSENFPAYLPQKGEEVALT